MDHNHNVLCLKKEEKETANIPVSGSNWKNDFLQSQN